MKRDRKETIHASIQTVVIIGTYINACSIVWGLQKIGFAGEIIMIDPSVDTAKCMAEVVLPDIKVIKKKILVLSEIITLIKANTKSDDKKLILMTAEEFIEPIREAIENGALLNTIAYTGSRKDNELIFDRLQFYRLVDRLNCVDVPKTIDSDEDPGQEFGNDYVIRVKKSWDGDKKLPRLEIVHSAEEASRVKESFLHQGLTRDMWCYQELLSTEDHHNVSVCGWYDPEFKQFVVTRKVLQHPPKTGNGDVVETYSEAPEYLLTATEAILKELDYSGAFEMEYVLDQRTDRYKVIELNPRFWMQHGLVEEVTNYALLRRALGMTEIDELKTESICHRYWINGLQGLYRLAKGQFRIVNYIACGTWYPSIWLALRWVPYYYPYKKAQ